MPRIRSTKPEYYSNPQAASCSRDARFLFQGMWCFCDDGGTHNADVKRLKMEVFPGDSCDDEQVQVWIDELKKAGLIHEYTAHAKTWWWVTGWHHQKVPRPCYKYPLPDIAEKTSSGSRLRDDNSVLEHVPNSVDSMLEHGGRNDSTMLEHVPDHVAHPADVDVDVDVEEKDASASCSEPKKSASDPPSEFVFPTVGKSAKNSR